VEAEQAACDGIFIHSLWMSAGQVKGFDERSMPGVTALPRIATKA